MREAGGAGDPSLRLRNGYIQDDTTQFRGPNRTLTVPRRLV